jgi:aspartyl-tRNA synthetase
MSFVECEDIYQQFEKIVAEVTSQTWGFSPDLPFQRLPYKEAMLHYGTDKPDLRYGLEIYDVSEIAGQCSFKVFRDAVESGGVVRGMAATGCLDLTRKIVDDLTAFVGQFGSKGLIWMRSKEEGIETQVAKFFKHEELEGLKEGVNGKAGDMLFFIAGPENVAATAMGQLRKEIARIKNLINGKKHQFLWIVDFPMFEYSQTEGRYLAMHHPFTAPRDDQIHLLDGDDLKDITAKAYDMVLDGVEIGGGSIRIHQSELQKKVFDCLGLSEAEVKRKFGYFVEAFRFGAPPHGGLAFGVDRFLATIEGRSSIRDFIPFPKTSSGTSLMEDCPSEVDFEQLRELHIRATEIKK